MMNDHICYAMRSGASDELRMRRTTTPYNPWKLAYRNIPSSMRSYGLQHKPSRPIQMAIFSGTYPLSSTGQVLSHLIDAPRRHSEAQDRVLAAEKE